MKVHSELELYSARVFNTSITKLYNAFANPLHLQKWWGPKGFTNTFHEFDLRPGGKWVLTMHGPEKGNYENSSAFKTVITNQLVAWTRISQPHFDMEVQFEDLEGSKSKLSFKMIFKKVEECNKLKNFVLPNNEENFDRLEVELQNMEN